MSYHEEDRETPAATVVLGIVCGGVLLLAAVAELGGLFTFGPAVEQGRHDTDKQTQGAVDGKNLTLAR
jgi:hypothetical protein